MRSTPPWPRGGGLLRQGGRWTGLLINRYHYTGSEGGYTDVRGQTNYQPGDTVDWDFNTLPVTLNIRAVLDGQDVPEELVRTTSSATTITFVTGRSAADASLCPLHR